MIPLPLIVSTGYASGLNVYMVVVVIGLYGRLVDTAPTPALLERTDVLVVAVLLALVDVFADNVPYLDSLWTLAHTFVRPVAAAYVSSLVSQAQDGDGVTAAVVGGSVALLSHTAKAVVRMGVNTSPEPFSTMLVSAGEQGAGLLVTVLAMVWPWAAAVLALLLLVVGTTVALLVFGLMRAVRRRWARWRARSRDGDGTGGVRGGYGAEP